MSKQKRNGKTQAQNSVALQRSVRCERRSIDDPAVRARLRVQYMDQIAENERAIKRLRQGLETLYEMSSKLLAPNDQAEPRAH